MSKPNILKAMGEFIFPTTRAFNASKLEGDIREAALVQKALAGNNPILNEHSLEPTLSSVIPTPEIIDQNYINSNLFPTASKSLSGRPGFKSVNAGNKEFWGNLSSDTGNRYTFTGEARSSSSQGRSQTIEINKVENWSQVDKIKYENNHHMWNESPYSSTTLDAYELPDTNGNKRVLLTQKRKLGPLQIERETAHINYLAGKRPLTTYSTEFKLFGIPLPGWKTTKVY